MDGKRCKDTSLERHIAVAVSEVFIKDSQIYAANVGADVGHSKKIESRSLTLSKFDYQGRPHMFYDDHLQLLRRSDCFVARKVWHSADRLYQTFLTDQDSALTPAEPNPGKIDRVFSKAVERRVRGRDGLYMQSRFPRAATERSLTAFPYSVIQGFTELF